MRGELVAALLVPTLLATGCTGGFARHPDSGTLASAVLVSEGALAEASVSRLGMQRVAGATSRDGLPRGDGRVEAAARQILADLRQLGDVRAVSARASVDAASRDLERLQRHVGAAWHFDVDPSTVDFLRVRLRAAIAPDGSVRAIELIDSHGGPEDVLARFVEDAIATLDWSSPLPVDGTDAAMRALVFRFEAGPARR